MRLFSGTGRGRARWLRHEDQGGIAKVQELTAELRDDTMDVPDNTIMTDPYWHDMIVPVCLRQ